MNSDELWLDEEFRRQYPLSAQRLQELHEQEQADLAYRQCLEVLQDIHAAAGLFEKELLEFSAEDLDPSPTDETPNEKERQWSSCRPADEARKYEKERQQHAARAGSTVPNTYQEEQE
jgi:hypothetical protein